MQNRGAISFFAITLIIVCIFQLSFTWITRKVENDAKDFATEATAGKSGLSQEGVDSLVEVYNRRYLDSIAGKPVYNVLIKNYTYRECKERELNLGLDLKGGMNVTMEVSVVDLIKSMSNYSQDAAFNQALDKAQQMQRNSQADFVTLFGDAYRSINPSGRLATIFNTIELKDKIKYESTNEEVLRVIRTEAADAIDRSFNILRTRIDKFGVTQPNIQKLDVSGRILIELPGVKDKERVRKLLQGTANLEFWETYENVDISPILITANDKIAALRAGSDTTSSTTPLISGSASVSADTSKNVAAAPATIDTTKTADNAVDTSKGLLGKLKQADSATAANDTSKVGKGKNPLFEIMQPAVFQNEKGYYPSPGPVVGYAAIKDTAAINKMLAIPQVKSLFPRDLFLRWTVKPYDKEGNFLQLVALKGAGTGRNRPALEGNVITDATGDFTQGSSAAEVNMTMSPEGALTWRKLTKANIQKSIAIVLDNYVYSYPTVQNEISGGRSNITGNFTINEAKDLANILKAGKLPAPAKIVSEAFVGPSLGQEAISAGLISFVIALLLVLLFMGFYYSTAGWVADIALLVNVFLIMGVLASMGAVLTLPGIAGIVLTIGLSVDANILIFERVREETAAGAGLKNSISEGFKNAMSSIIDSNITTLLLGIILYVFGTGPIQGFATTLIIGILTSLFSAIFITRIVFDKLLDRNKNIAFSTKLTENAFKKINIDFVGKRKIYYMISSIFILIGVVFFFKNGFNFGVDFQGGRTYVVRFEKDVNQTDVRESLAKVFGEETGLEVKTYGGDHQQKITTTYLIEETKADTDDRVEAKLIEGLSSLGVGSEVVSTQKVGPTIADDIKSSAVWAILFGCLLMFIYIFIRFKKWQYGLGSVVALIHDVLLVLSCYTIFNGILPFSLEINQDFIAAILTVMGYSMTDTVVVFDRIREYLSDNKKTDLAKGERNRIINYALNSTLSRTINTSLTIFFVLLAIFIFGGEVIRGFSFALLIGIVIGTYSSICIATPVVIDFDKKEDEAEANVKVKVA